MNWEWGNWILAQESGFRFWAVYQPTGSGAIDRLMTFWRDRWGTRSVPMRQTRQLLATTDLVLPRPVLVGLLAEQNPSNLGRAAWVPFFGVRVPFHTGFEDLARAHGVAVVYIEIFQTRRGHYDSAYHLLTENAADLPAGELVRRFAAHLEASIRRHPENWLWTHRRWKHRHHAPPEAPASPA
jgi:KDO2-lipid IV(A) lauroyltransferase